MKFPKTDNCCTNMDWVEYLATAGDQEIHFSVAHGTNLGDTFRAFCHDYQEPITINGWTLSNVEEVEQ